jgi:hypothetical protein
MSTFAGIHEVQIVQQVKLHKEVHAWLENLVHSRRTILVKEGTCVFHNSSRPIYNCVNCKEDGTCRVHPPVELIAKNSCNQSYYIRYYIEIVILNIGI